MLENYFYSDDALVIYIVRNMHNIFKFGDGCQHNKSLNDPLGINVIFINAPISHKMDNFMDYICKEQCDSYEKNRDHITNDKQEMSGKTASGPNATLLGD